MRAVRFRGPLAVGGVVTAVSFVSMVLTGSAASASEAAGTTYALGAPVVFDLRPEAVAVDPSTHTAYVGSAGEVHVVDEATSSVIRAVPTSLGDFSSIAVSPATHDVYATDSGSDGLSAVDPATGIATAIDADTREPWGVAADPATNTFYVVGTTNVLTGHYAGYVSVVSGATDQPTAHLNIGSILRAVAVDPTTDTIYATDIDNTDVVVIDAAKDTITATVPVGRDPSAIAVDPVTRKVYVTNTADSTVSVISEATDDVLATVPIAGGPDAVAVDTSAHTVEVASYYTNTVTVLDEATDDVSATVAVGLNPAAIAIDPDTHTSYVTTNSNDLDVITASTGSTPARSVPPDNFNADGRSVPATVSSNGTWFVTGHPGPVRFGSAGDVPAVTDDKTGRAHIGVFRPSDGTWYINQDDSHAPTKTRWGATGDIPVAAHYNGPDHATVLATFRPSTGAWYIKGTARLTYGAKGDIPVPGHYFGTAATDYRDQPAVFRPAAGTWYVRGHGSIRYGQQGDIPVPGDYDGNGTTDIAVYRPSTQTWYVRGHAPVHFGARGDIPITGDFTADGTTSIAIYRPVDGTWKVRGLGTIARTSTKATPVEESSRRP